VTAEEATPGALARSQAARRRRVLDATLSLAAEGGFDAVQMRDVAAAADVALGTVYRYFSSKERLLLEAMVEQQDDLRRYIESHPPTERAASDRVSAVLRRANKSLRAYPDVTAAMVRSIGSAQNENADIVRSVTEIMTATITQAIHGTEHRAATPDELRVARILMQVWLSSLNGWVCGVDGPDRVDEDLDGAARLLLD
jgi:AcrR family transcriptional regulator